MKLLLHDEFIYNLDASFSSIYSSIYIYVYIYIYLYILFNCFNLYARFNAKHMNFKKKDSRLFALAGSGLRIGEFQLRINKYSNSCNPSNMKTHPHRSILNSTKDYIARLTSGILNVILRPFRYMYATASFDGLLAIINSMLLICVDNRYILLYNPRLCYSLNEHRIYEN